MPPLLGMPLDMFAREGQPLEVRVAWWPVRLFFVPDVHHAEALGREAILPVGWRRPMAGR
jgi:hypothetical protein